jgi:hypothetical protein
MKEETKSPHFEGMSAKEHLIKARIKGLSASSELHGVEAPGRVHAFIDATKDTSIAALILCSATETMLAAKTSALILACFLVGWIIWKTIRSALLGWMRLGRLHKLIEEERWEIEHNREQEREELREMYKVKGFSGKLLDDVVDVLMSDDNRLLGVMLEEELGLHLEVHEHPLSQALGALFGSLIVSATLFTAFFFGSFYVMALLALVTIALASVADARYEKSIRYSHIVWNVAAASICSLAVITLARFFIHL